MCEWMLILRLYGLRARSLGPRKYRMNGTNKEGMDRKPHTPSAHLPVSLVNTISPVSDISSDGLRVNLTLNDDEWNNTREKNTGTCCCSECSKGTSRRVGIE